MLFKQQFERINVILLSDNEIIIIKTQHCSKQSVYLWQIFQGALTIKRLILRVWKFDQNQTRIKLSFHWHSHRPCDMAGSGDNGGQNENYR